MQEDFLFQPSLGARLPLPLYRNVTEKVCHFSALPIPLDLWWTGVLLYPRLAALNPKKMFFGNPATPNGILPAI